MPTRLRIIYLIANIQGIILGILLYVILQEPKAPPFYPLLISIPVLTALILSELMRWFRKMDDEINKIILNCGRKDVNIPPLVVSLTSVRDSTKWWRTGFDQRNAVLGDETSEQ